MLAPDNQLKATARTKKTAMVMRAFLSVLIWLPSRMRVMAGLSIFMNRIAKTTPPGIAALTRKRTVKIPAPTANKALP